MTKKDLLTILKNVDDDAIILLGKNEYSHSIATEVYVKEKTESEESKILITNDYITAKTPVFFEKIYG